MLFLIFLKNISCSSFSYFNNAPEMLEVDGLYSDSNESVQILVISKHPSENCILAFYTEQEYQYIRPQLMNISHSRKERVSLIRNSSSSSLCETGIFKYYIELECYFEFTHGGTLILFPELFLNVFNYTVKIPDEYFISYQKDAKTNKYILSIFATLVNVVITPFIYCCKCDEEFLPYFGHEDKNEIEIMNETRPLTFKKFLILDSSDQ